MEPKSLYDRTAGIYDRRHESPSSAWLRRHQDAIIRGLKGRTIDIGCGTGRELGMLDDVVGIDPSAKMLEAAKSSGKETLLGRAERLPFPGASFDNALCLFCVLNMCGHGKAVAEMSRVLKEGGTAVVSVASVWDRKYTLRKKLGLKHPAKEKAIAIDGNKMLLRLFEREELVELFLKNGMALRRFIPLFKFQKPLWGNWNRLPLRSRIRLRLDRLPLLGSYGAVYLMVFKKTGNK